jgi:hypothetical protein
MLQDWKDELQAYIDSQKVLLQDVEHKPRPPLKGSPIYQMNDDLNKAINELSGRIDKMEVAERYEIRYAKPEDEEAQPQD